MNKSIIQISVETSKFFFSIKSTRFLKYSFNYSLKNKIIKIYILDKIKTIIFDELIFYLTDL